MVDKKKQKEKTKDFKSFADSRYFVDYIDFVRSPWKTFAFNFLRGTGFGLGTIIGVAIVLTILTYVIHAFGGIPVVGEWVLKFGEVTQLQ